MIIRFVPTKKTDECEKKIVQGDEKKNIMKSLGGWMIFAMLMQSRGKIKRLGILANATVKTSSDEETTEPYIIKKKIGLSVYLILAIFGLSIVSQGIMQSDFNSFEAKTFSYSQSLPQEVREEQ